MPLPVLPARRGPMCCLRAARPRHNTSHNPGGIRLHPTFSVDKRLLCLTIPADVLRLGLLQRAVAQELAPPVPVKHCVFGDWLRFMAFPAIGTLRVWGMGHLPLFFQAEVTVPDTTSVRAFLPLCWPRPSSIELCPALTNLRPDDSACLDVFPHRIPPLSPRRARPLSKTHGD